MEITVSLDFGDDAAAYAAHEEAFAEVEAAGGGAVRFVLLRNQQWPTNIRAVIMPGVLAEGVAGAAGTLDDGRLYYSTAYYSGRRPIATHEVLHLVGLPDTSTEGDIMCSCSHDPNRRMSPGERARVRDLVRLRYGR